MVAAHHLMNCQVPQRGRPHRACHNGSAVPRRSVVCCVHPLPARARCRRRQTSRFRYRPLRRKTVDVVRLRPGRI